MSSKEVPCMCSFPYFRIDEEVIKAELRRQYGVGCPLKQGLADFYETLTIENNVAEKFMNAGINPFPEVTLAMAAKILGCQEEELQNSIRERKLRARKIPVYGTVIRVVDLWIFAKYKEAERLKKKAKKKEEK